MGPTDHFKGKHLSIDRGQEAGRTVLLVCMVDVEEGEMVPIDVAEASFRLICSFLGLPGPEKAIGY